MSKLLETALGDNLFVGTTGDGFPKTHTRRGDPVTSYNAAVRVSYRVGSQKAKIIEAMRGRVPMQFEEIAKFAGMEPHAVARRRADLERDGYIIVSTRTKPLSSGCEGQLWQLRSTA